MIDPWIVLTHRLLNDLVLILVDVSEGLKCYLFASELGPEYTVFKS